MVSLRKISEIIGEIVGKRPNFKIVENSTNDLVADIKLMIQNLCWPKVSIKEGIENTYEWMQE